MDNLTHSMVGALMAQMGLKRKTGLAMPVMIIGANIPDIDAVATYWGAVSLSIRRGMTHGPVALLILPIILWVMAILYDRWQGRRGRRSADHVPVRGGWLLLLAYVATLSHPLFDWFNSYGIRLMEPFSHRWFYGDMIFIVDIWIWGLLGGALWWSRSLEKLGETNWRRPAQYGAAILSLYILANGAISLLATQNMRRTMDRDMPSRAGSQIVANPVPLTFWRREMLFGRENRYYRAIFSLFDRDGMVGPVSTIRAEERAGDEIVRLRNVRVDADLKAFLFWSRMPYLARAGSGDLRIYDARFGNPLVKGRFSLPVPEDEIAEKRE